MEIYADGVLSGLKQQGVNIKEFIPTSRLEYWHKNAVVMRYLRYFHYPQLVKKNKVDNTATNDLLIHHVSDHGYAHLYPYLGQGKKCLSVHDIIPYLTYIGEIKADQEGETFDFKKPRLNLYSLKFIKLYDQIITISQSTADDLSKYLGIDSDKIAIVPPVIDEKFHQVEQQRVNQFSEKYNLDRSFKWLMVSGREYYKNHRTSLNVLKALLNKTDIKIKLIKTGRPCSEFNSLVRELDLLDHVEQLYFEDVSELPLLYNVVDCLLFPSLYEGFGMPVAEALACGTPVVMSNQASLPEVGNEFAIQHDCFDIDGMVQSVVKVLNDQEFISRQKQSALKWSEKFHAPSIGKALCNVYDNIP